MKANSIALFAWGLSGGAITNMVAALAKGFIESGISTIYVVYLHDIGENRVKFPSTVKPIALKAKHTKLSSFAIARFLRAYQPDIFISFAFLNIPSIIGYLLAGKVKTKLIVSQQNSMIYQAQVEHQGNWLFKAQLYLAKYLYPQADGLIATTKPVLDELIATVGIKFRHTKTRVIPNILDIEGIVAKSQANSTHPWLRQKQTPTIISVARLAKQKNFPLLFAAVALAQKQIQLKLIIFGQGNEREELEKLIKAMNLEDSISLAGYSTNPYTEMAHADAFVLSSEEEAFGLVLVEAMATGTPVIATDAMGEGPRTIIDDNQYGLLVPNHNPSALAAAIVKTLTNAELRDRLVAAGKERCQTYRPEVITQAWLKSIEDLT